MTTHGNEYLRAEDRGKEAPYRRQRIALDDRGKDQRNDERHADRPRERRGRHEERNHRRQRIRDEQCDMHGRPRRRAEVVAEAVLLDARARVPVRQQRARRQRHDHTEPGEHREHPPPRRVGLDATQRPRQPRRPHDERHAEEADDRRLMDR
jgi:hypothetical protein